MFKKLLSVLGICIPMCFVSAQVDYAMVEAQQGDGIFSILRKQGLNPGKYYGEFLELNQDKLAKGSNLQLGVEYKVPLAEDSYKQTVVKVQAKDSLDQPLFDQELAEINPVSNKLSEAVIYLIAGNDLQNASDSIRNLSDQITQRLAKELMIHGAQVYVIQSDKNAAPDPAHINVLPEEKIEDPMASFAQMQEYVDLVNKRYVKHWGKYQRLIITRVEEVVERPSWEVSIFHQENNGDSKQIAENLQSLFRDQSAKSQSISRYTEVFKHHNNLYLAKNSLPAVTLIDIGKRETPELIDRISVKRDYLELSTIIAEGVMQDYAKLQLEE